MPDVAFVLPGVPSRLAGLAHVLRCELERQGMATSVHLRFPEPEAGRLYVFVDPGRFLEAGGAAALPPTAVLGRTLVLTSQGSATGPDAPRPVLDAAGRVFDISQAAVSAMHAEGISARLLRPGYIPEWDQFDAQAHRDIDIAYFDVHTTRRARLLCEAADVLSRYPASIRLLDAGIVEGDERRALLRRSKIALQLHAGRDTRLDWIATMEAMHCGAVVVTEHSSETGPFEVGRDLFAGSSASIPWVAEQLVRDPGRLQRARGDAYERLRDWVPFSVSIGVLRASLVEMLGWPLDDETSEDVHVGLEHDQASDSTVVLSQLEATHRDLADVQRKLDHLQASIAVPQNDARPRGPQTNAAWKESSQSPLCAVLTVDRDAAAALHTLESLTAQQPLDLELIVAWSSSPLKEVTDWLDARPAIPVAQVSGAGGLAATRNAALEIVRAPLCLLIDAGLWTFPRCREQLTRTLTDDATLGFAYPIQAVSPASDLGVGDDCAHLVGFREWGPDAQPGAPVMARTQLLREAGGFVGNSPREGVERDEIWFRMPKPGRLIAEILSRSAVTGLRGDRARRVDAVPA